MTPGTRKSLIVAAVHVALVATLGGKLLVDRETRPRGWAQVRPYDPDLPIRGRYVRLRILAPLDRPLPDETLQRVTLSVQNDQLMASPADPGARALYASPDDREDGQLAVSLNEPVAYFIPEHVPDPSLRPPDEELWVEVTIPRAGAPRPIRLGVKKNGVLTPLDLD